MVRTQRPSCRVTQLIRALEEFATLTTRWRDDYYHQTAFSDGEIYCKVWGFREQDAKAQENLWMSRLSAPKQDSLNRLMRRNGFAKALEALFDFPGLWGGLELGNVRRLLAMKCDEVGSSAICFPSQADQFRRL